MEDSTRTKLELIRRVFHKAGIPMAFSVAGFIFARIYTSRKPESHSNSIKITNSIELKDEENCSREDTLANAHDINSRGTQNICELEGQILRVNANLQDLHSKELELELKFTHLCDLKNQEMELMELGNSFLLEIARTELLHRELLLIEAESKRFEDMVIAFQKLMEQLQYFRVENGMLHRKIRRISRKARRRSRVIFEQNLQIEVGKSAILQNGEELERRADRINVLECKIVELEMSSEKLQDEKDQLLNKLDLAQNSASLKIEEECMILEDYNKLMMEVKQRERDRTAEVKEAVYLRWCSACLRLGMMRRNQVHEEKEEGHQQQQQQDLDLRGNDEIGGEHESDGFKAENGDSRIGCANRSHSKRPRLIEKFKRWVEGSEKTKRKSNEKNASSLGGGAEK